jgi:hypothetical protein
MRRQHDLFLLHSEAQQGRDNKAVAYAPALTCRVCASVARVTAAAQIVCPSCPTWAGLQQQQQQQQQQSSSSSSSSNN